MGVVKESTFEKNGTVHQMLAIESTPGEGYPIQINFGKSKWRLIMEHAEDIQEWLDRQE